MKRQMGRQTQCFIYIDFTISAVVKIKNFRSKHQLKAVINYEDQLRLYDTDEFIIHASTNNSESHPGETEFQEASRLI